jgi:hypothetical protein
MANTEIKIPDEYEVVPTVPELPDGYELVDDAPDVGLDVAGERGRELSFRQGTPKTAWQKFTDMFREDAPALRAKAQNAIAYSEMFNIPVGEAYTYHDEISEQLGGQDMPTTFELASGVVALPVVHALMYNPVGAVLGVAAYETIAEAESAAIQAWKGEKYKAFQHKGLKDLIPEDSTDLSNTVVESLDFLAKGLAAHKVFRLAPKLSEKIAREIITEHGGPKEIWIDPADLKAELQTGGVIGADELSIVKELGLTGKQYRQAIKDGLNIKVAPEKIVTIQDRPWYAGVKKLFKIDPKVEVRTSGGKVEDFSFGKGEAQKPATTPTQKAFIGQGDTPEAVAEKLGIKYDDFYKDGNAYQFTDPKTGSTLNARNLEDLPTKLDDMRAEFERKGGGLLGAAKKETITEEPAEKVYYVGEKSVTSEENTVETPRVVNLDKAKAFKSVTDAARSNAITKAAKDFAKNEKDANEYVKQLKAAGLERDAAAAEKLLGEDVYYDLETRLVDEEIKLLEKITQKSFKKKQPKTTIRENTGQRKVKELIEVDESAALKDQIRLEARAARMAFAEGKKVSALKHKERQRILLERARERARTKKKIRGIQNRLKKPTPKTVDFYYREAIDNIKGLIDPNFRTEKTIGKRNRTKEFLEKHPDKVVDMPKKLFAMLDKNTLNDFTVEDLEAVDEEIKRLIKHGALKRKLERSKRRREINEARDNIVATMIGEISKGTPRPIVKATIKEGKSGSRFRAARATTLRPERIADLIDGYQNFEGPTHDFFIDRVNAAENNKIDSRGERRDFIEGGREKLNITVADLVEEKIYDDIPYTLDERLDIYAGSLNDSKKLAIIHGNNIPEETISRIVNGLTAEEKELARLIIKDYEANKDRLRESVIKYENRDLGYEENYTPIRRTEIDYTTMTQEIVDEILHRSHYKKGATEKGFTIDRSKIPAEFQRPIRLGLYQTWLEQMPKQEQYIHMTPVVKDMHKVLEDKTFRDAVQQSSTIGTEHTRALKNYVDRVANPNIYKSFNHIENLSRELRNNTALYYLAGNVMTMAKQVPSVLFYLPEAGPVHLSASFADFIKDPIGQMERVRGFDPQVRERQIERELEELKALDSGAYHQAKRFISKYGMAGIYAMDRVAITIGWNAVYNRYLPTLGHEGAVKKAQAVTLRTQPQAGVKNLPDIYATNEIFNWFTQFTNQLNQVYNIGTHDIKGYAKNKDYYKVALTAAAIALNALWIWSITNKKLPEGADDVADAFSDQALNALPVVGRQINQGRKGFDDTGIPPFGGVSDVAKGVMEGSPENIIDGIGLLVGAPGVFTKRTWRAIDKEDPSQMLGKK